MGVSGNDCTNELSYLCLNAQEHLRLALPNFPVRVHKKSPTEFLFRVAEVIRIGTGMPQIMNDDVCIPALLNNGLQVQEARDYAPIGCVEIAIAGSGGVKMAVMLRVPFQANSPKRSIKGSRRASVFFLVISWQLPSVRLGGGHRWCASW